MGILESTFRRFIKARGTNRAKAEHAVLLNKLKNSLYCSKGSQVNK